MFGSDESVQDKDNAGQNQVHQGEASHKMSEIEETPRTYSGALLAAIALALLCAAAA